jgi:hypothetical protein
MAPLEQPPVWSPYLDADQDLKPWLNSTKLTGMEAQIQLSNDFACEWVQDFLQRPVAPTKITEYLDGWTGLDGAYLMMRYFPVISWDLVTESRGVNGAHVLTEQTPQNQSAQDSFQGDYLTGRLIRTFPGLVPRPWYPGSRNIVVTYTAGYETVPQAIKVATLEFAKYWFRRSFDPRQSGRNDFADDSGSQLWPGIPNRVSELLAPYKNLVLV